jgi:hypothetical protein
MDPDICDVSLLYQLLAVYSMVPLLMDMAFFIIILLHYHILLYLHELKVA